MILELNTVVPRLSWGGFFPNKFDRVPRRGLKKIAERAPHIEFPEGSRVGAVRWSGVGMSSFATDFTENTTETAHEEQRSAATDDSSSADLIDFFWWFFRNFRGTRHASASVPEQSATDWKREGTDD